ncbi:hypothetical protein ACNJX9_35550 [Bradyrhizobium sp. DASA03076]|uniref:hypothetical protein n=1 Tax=Bradyrhizobium sp. BLXBL-03 TaxID=3395916 RepID=UPI003F730D7C
MIEPMTPLQTISDWFEKQHVEIQGEIIAGMALLLDFNDRDFLALDNEQQGEFLRQWNDGGFGRIRVSTSGPRVTGCDPSSLSGVPPHVRCLSERLTYTLGWGL